MTIKIKSAAISRLSTACLLATLLLSGCAATASVDQGGYALTPGASPTPPAPPPDCPVTEAEWLTPPDDSAVLNDPAPGYYYVNNDLSMWASAWWTGEEDYPLQAGEEGNKVGWFRPAGAELQITGRLIDGESAGFEAQVPCCYPTRFHATGLYFTGEGCWEITAKAAGSELSFVVWVAP